MHVGDEGRNTRRTGPGSASGSGGKSEETDQRQSQASDKGEDSGGNLVDQLEEDKIAAGAGGAMRLSDDDLEGTLEDGKRSQLLLTRGSSGDKKNSPFGTC